jgi:hypothetical protein
LDGGSTRRKFCAYTEDNTFRSLGQLELRMAFTPNNCTATSRGSGQQLQARRYFSAGVLHCQSIRVSLCYELNSSAERNKRERERETNKRQVGEAHSLLITAILLSQRITCYCGKIVSLRMITNLRLADLGLTTAQQTSTGQNLRLTYT